MRHVQLIAACIALAAAACAPRASHPDSAATASGVGAVGDSSSSTVAPSDMEHDTARAPAAAPSAPTVPMPAAAAGSSPTAAAGSTTGGDHALVDSLERAARALARTDGCTGADQCRAAPLGAKACGGPRDYLVYCALTTDTVRLFRTLAALARAEKAYNAKHQMVSTCEMRLPPMPGLVAGRCSAGAGGNAGPR